jgi:segregation and condensation protein B
MAFNLKKVLKALLFSSSRPLTAKDIQDAFTRFHEQALLPLAPTAQAVQNPADQAAPVAEEADVPELPDDLGVDADVPSLITSAQIREAMDEIAAELRAADDVYLLIEGASGYRLVTHPRFARWIRILRAEPPPMKLSQSALETLAVVAYRQPVTRAEIEHIRGVSAEAGLNKLLERELVYVVGRAELPGRPIQYGTTDAFMEFVGVKSLDELPASDVLSHRQIDAWLESAMKPKHLSDSDMGLEQETLPLSPADEPPALAEPKPA